MATPISKINTLLLLEILKKHSSPEHPVTNSGIQELARKELRKLNIIDATDSATSGSKSGKISTSTVQRTLEELSELCYDYPSFAHLLGGSVRILLKNDTPGGSGFILYDPDIDDKENKNTGEIERKTQNKTRYYCFDPILTPEEINVLATSVSANPFLSFEQNQELNRKILDLFPVQLSSPGYGSSSGTIIPRTLDQEKEHIKNEKLLANITFLLSRIRANSRIRIHYGKYDLFRHDLITRSHDQFMELEPVTITWSNGFAYLLALKVHEYEQSDLSSQIYHYRIDRIIEIRDVLDDHSEPVKCSYIGKLGNRLNILEYQKQHPVMYGGKKQRITFLAKDYEDAPLANLLVDTFGLEYRVQKANTGDTLYLGDLYTEEPNSWFRITVNATAAGTELWAMQHADRVRIISPDSVVREMEKRFRAAMQLNRPLK